MGCLSVLDVQNTAGEVPSRPGANLYSETVLVTGGTNFFKSVQRQAVGLRNIHGGLAVYIPQSGVIVAGKRGVGDLCLRDGAQVSL